MTQALRDQWVERVSKDALVSRDGRALKDLQAYMDVEVLLVIPVHKEGEDLQGFVVNKGNVELMDSQDLQ